MNVTSLLSLQNGGPVATSGTQSGAESSPLNDCHKKVLEWFGDRCMVANPQGVSPDSTRCLMLEDGEVYTGDIKGGLAHGYGESSNSSETFIGGFNAGKRVYGRGTVQSKTNEDTRQIALSVFPLSQHISAYVGPWVNNQPNGIGSLMTSGGRVIYYGKVNNGIPHGHGYGIGLNNNELYKGEWVEGRPHGKGLLLRWRDGEIYETYEGDMKNGLPNGSGKLTDTKRGIVYGGSFNDGSSSNITMIIYSSKKEEGEVKEEKYEGGTMIRGQRHGHGTMNYADGRRYEGSWAADLYHGHGTLKDKSGTYTGEFKFGARHGMGSSVDDTTRDKYEGGFELDLRHGQGKMIYADESVYEGEWVADLRHGQGQRSYSDGEVYKGPFSRGKRQGWGEQVYASKSKYVGGFDNNEWNGKGVLSCEKSGNVYTGVFSRKNKNVEGTLTTKDGTESSGTFSYSKAPLKEDIAALKK